MKKIIMIFLVGILNLVNLTGCYKNNLVLNDHKDNMVSETSINSGRKSTPTKISQGIVKQDENKEEDKVIISDITNWKHPIKELLMNNGLKLKKVELTKKGTYPTFILDTFSDFYLENNDFINNVAEKNGYWDFKLTDGHKFIEVYCDKANRIIYKTVSNTKTIDISNVRYSDYDGIWYATSFAHSSSNYSKITIKFEKSNRANIILESLTGMTGHVTLSKNTIFDFAKEGKLSTFDKSSNKIDGKISLDDLSEIMFTSLPSSVVKDKSNTFTAGFGHFVREKDYVNIQRAMKILEDKYHFKDMNNGLYIPKVSDADSVYFDYENKTDDGKYIIAVRRCKDTSIYAWYKINPVTKEVDIEKYY